MILAILQTIFGINDFVKYVFHVLDAEQISSCINMPIHMVLPPLMHGSLFKTPIRV